MFPLIISKHFYYQMLRQPMQPLLQDVFDETSFFGRLRKCDVFNLNKNVQGSTSVLLRSTIACQLYLAADRS